MQRFELLGRNGAGANSTVFRCRDLASGAVVAVKRPDGTATCQQVLHEAAVMRACSHEYILKLLEAYQGNSSGAFYMVLEHAEHSLSRELLLNPRGLPFDKVKLITYQLAQALEHMHGKQITHCDLKPANVLLTSQCNVKLCDFGSARSPFLSGALTDGRLAAAGSTGLPPDVAAGTDVAATTTAAASRWYCAPEALLGGEGTPESDMWALGCIMAEMVTGRPLLPGSDEELNQLCCVVTMLGRLSDSQERLMQLLPPKQRACVEAARAQGPLLERIPRVAACPELAEVLHALLNPDPARRPAARQLQDMPFFADVRHVLHGSKSATAVTAAPTLTYPLPILTRGRSLGCVDCIDGLQIQRRASSGVISDAIAAATVPPIFSDSTKPVAAALPAASGAMPAYEAVSAVCGGALAIAGCPKAPGLVSAFATAAGCVPPIATASEEAPSPQLLDARPRVSALTATIRGRLLKDDGGYTDLMPAVLQLVARWEEALQGERLGPIAMAARRARSASLGCATGPTAPGTVGPQVPSVSGSWASVDPGCSTAAIAASMAAEHRMAAITCTTPGGIVGAVARASAMEFTPPVAPAMAAAGPATGAPSTPCDALTGAVTGGCNTEGSESISRDALSCNALITPSAPSDASLAPPASTAVAVSGPSPALQSGRNLTSRPRRLHSHELHSLGSVPLSVFATCYSRAGAGFSGTQPKAPARARADVRQHGGSSSDGGARRVRVSKHAARRSFSGLSNLACVAESAPLECATPPDVKRRRAQSSVPVHAASSTALDGVPCGGNENDCTGTDQRMRQSDSGGGFGFGSPMQDLSAHAWQPLAPVGIVTMGRAVSMPQPIAGRCSGMQAGLAASGGRGLGISFSSEVVGSEASDSMFFRGDVV
ncbi:hypothetical protein Agub_g15066 [Astrephomene gubernaculifera]|uniref:Protein kinase domain-containing protein n=1 Tax=Astrephomene gubernaculifera TaxID=47775 RepID=A0AAD3E2G2_9CHLO|nr:hypothetical protein Agub_g15066 [Astrephomene gubernaculifera]